MRAATPSSGGIKAGPVAVLSYLFAFIWLGIYTVGLANQVQTGGLGLGALGEMIPLLAGLPILLISISARFSIGAIISGLIAIFALFADSVAFQNSLVSGQILNGLQTLSTQTQGLVYQTSPQSLVVTLGAFGTSEEGGFGMLSRTLLDFLFGVQPGQHNYILKGIVASIPNGIFFSIWHIFVTAAVYAQLLNAPPIAGFNVAILLTPFGLSAVVARIILDTFNRMSKDYTTGIIGHAGYDMIVTAKALGLW